MIRTCLPFIGSDQNHLARNSERRKKTGQTEEKKRWEDIIREWTGLEFAKSKRAVESTERKKKGRKLVMKSSLVPQRPSRLRDR